MVTSNALAVHALPQLDQVALGPAGGEVAHHEEHADRGAHPAASPVRAGRRPPRPQPLEAPSSSARIRRAEKRPVGPRQAPSESPRRRSRCSGVAGAVLPRPRSSPPRPRPRARRRHARCVVVAARVGEPARPLRPAGARSARSCRRSRPACSAAGSVERNGCVSVCAPTSIPAVRQPRALLPGRPARRAPARHAQPPRPARRAARAAASGASAEGGHARPQRRRPAAPVGERPARGRRARAASARVVATAGARARPTTARGAPRSARR